jgi:hypothetical protein
MRLGHTERKRDNNISNVFLRKGVGEEDRKRQRKRKIQIIKEETERKYDTKRSQEATCRKR